MRFSPVAVSLVAFAVATGAMEILGTPWLDRAAFHWGLAIAAGAGGAVGGLVARVKTPRRHRIAIAGGVLGAGALVGMAIQAVLLARVPETRTYVLASGLTTREPLAWVLAGAGLGVVPAAVVALAIFLAHRVASPVPAHDGSARVLVPFAGATAVVASASLGMADGQDLPVVVALLCVALAALAAVVVTDRRRARWLADVFAGRTAYEVVVDPRAANQDDVPLAVAAVFPRAFVMRTGASAYRSAARTPWARLAPTLDETLAPIDKRRTRILQLVALATGAGILGLFVR